LIKARKERIRMIVNQTPMEIVLGKRKHKNSRVGWSKKAGKSIELD
jgi:hypothetical protein